jgi:hypothetical protein
MEPAADDARPLVGLGERAMVASRNGMSEDAAMGRRRGAVNGARGRFLAALTERDL